MLPPDPGRDESAFIGYAIIDALLDLLIDKGVVTRSEVSVLLRTVVDTLGKKGEFMGKRAAKVLADGVPK